LRLPLRALSSSCSADPQPTVLPALSLPDALPICDIGGTNARFALVREGEVQPQAIEVLPCSDYVNLDAAIVDYLRRAGVEAVGQDRKSTRLNSSHVKISYAVFCLKKKKRMRRSIV